MGYKMKGFSGFKPSPVKVSDSEVVAAQDKLDHVELDYKTPGWAKALGSVFGGGKEEGGQKQKDSKTTKDKESKKVKKVQTEFPTIGDTTLKRSDMTAGGL